MTTLNTRAQDWQDDLETYGDAFANVIVYDADQVTHLTDFQLQPADLRVVFAALRDAATESTQVDRPRQRTTKEIVEIVLGLESLGSWEDRLKAAVALARSEWL